MTFADWLYARNHALDGYKLGTRIPSAERVKLITKQELVGAADQTKLSTLLTNVASWPALPNGNDPNDAKRTAKALELNALLNDADHREMAREFLRGLAQNPYADYWTTL